VIVGYPTLPSLLEGCGDRKCPFQIVNNHGFRSLMKTGRPECYIPSAETISCDVKKVFVHVHNHIATMLQVSLHYSIMDHLAYRPSGIQGKLSFATDAWTSPNHKAFVAITVHLEHEGKPLLLDLVEVPMSHTGENLARAFAEVLQTFGIQEKVRNFDTEIHQNSSKR